MPQGYCTLPADDAGRILDRLAGLEQVIRPADIQQALTATGRGNSRLCTLTHEVMLWVVLAMGLLTDLPIRQVFKHARRLRRGEESPHRSSLCVARRRLGVAPVRRLFAENRGGVICLNDTQPPRHMLACAPLSGSIAEGSV
jgi:Insertion element 4 transposase N-terminal